MKTLIFLTIFCAAQAFGINKIEIITTQNRTLIAQIWGKNTTSLLVLYNNSNLTPNCSLTKIGKSFDGIVRKWELKCKLPKSSGRLIIKYQNPRNQSLEINKFIE